MSAQDAAHAQKLRALILSDGARRQALEVAEHLVQQHALPDALLAAGFVRNCCWDYLHGLAPTALNDVDLIYTDAAHTSAERDQKLQEQLALHYSAAKWQVKNQARMHLKHGDPIYKNSIDAMRYWPEQETAVGIRLDGTRQVVASFGFDSLFAGQITPGPHRQRDVCLRRADKKKWLQQWATLELM